MLSVYSEMKKKARYSVWKVGLMVNLRDNELTVLYGSNFIVYMVKLRDRKRKYRGTCSREGDYGERAANTGD